MIKNLLFTFIVITFSFGYVTLDISGVDSRDSGEYICRATNRYIGIFFPLLF